jgi:hypothetical protein
LSKSSAVDYETQWTTAGGGGNAPLLLGRSTADSSWRSGYAYCVNEDADQVGGVGVAAVNISAGDIRYVPVRFSTDITIARMGFFAGGATPAWEARLAIYDSTGANGYAGALIEDVGVVPVSTTGVKFATFGSPRTLSAGVLYWFAYRGSVGYSGSQWVSRTKSTTALTHMGTTGAELT